MRGTIATTALFAASVYAHGNITSPPARIPGAAMVKACGQTAVNAVLQDGTTPLEDVLQPLASCKLDLCRGAVFEDNKDRVQTFTPGQVIPMKAQLPIPHEGPANVSIVKTATNKIVGQMLLVFDTYADEKLATLPANNTAFSVTMPTTLGTDCAVAGECVLQWFWFGTSAKQTYESCVDFVMAGSATTNKGSSSGTGTGTGTGSTTTGGRNSTGTGTGSTTTTGRNSTGTGSASGSGSTGSLSGGSRNSTGSGSSTGGGKSGSGSSAAPVSVAASAAIPGTGEGNFGGVEGSMPRSNIGTPAVKGGSASAKFRRTAGLPRFF